MGACHFCRQESYGNLQPSGLEVCDDCMRGIQEISNVMYRTDSMRSETRIAKVKDLDGPSGGMATFLPPELYGGWDELSVIRYDDLEVAVLSGWRPLMLLYKDDINKGYDNVVVGRDQYNNETRNEFEHFAVGRIPLFLVGRTNEQAKMHDKIKRQSAEVKSITEALNEGKKEIEKLKTAVEVEKRRADCNFESSKENAESSRKERKLRYKLEEDVSKLRKAVGELKAKELLGEDS